jgi:hypothetical protein
MIDVKEAVKSAMQAIHEFYDQPKFTDLTLEEVEQTDNEWLITLSFVVPNQTPIKNNLFAMTAAANDRQYLRKYKIFTINTESGQVRSMKIREL